MLLKYLSAQAAGDVEDALELIADDAVFDVGRGRFQGGDVRTFLERLRRIHSVTTVVDLEEHRPREVTGVLAQRDDDLAPLGLDEIRLDVDVTVNDDARIVRFRARPTAESLAAISKARDAGRRSEGVDLAERAGNLPQS